MGEKEKGELEGKKMKFDDIFEWIGGLGWYQLILFFTIGAAQFWQPVDNVVLNFAAFTEDHWCKVDGVWDKVPHGSQQDIVAPKRSDDANNYDQCQMYNFNYSDFTIEDYRNWNRSEMIRRYNPPIIKCNSGWVFKKTVVDTSLREEWSMVCDRTWLSSLAASIYMLGRLLAAMPCGTLSDTFGRKPVGVFVVCLRFVASFGRTFAPNFPVFAVSMFFLGIGTTNIIAYCLMQEIIAEKFRPGTNYIWHQWFSVGYMILPVMGYFIRDFRKLLFAISMPGFGLCLYAIALRESPRWYIAREKPGKAKKLLEFVAKVNKCSLPQPMEFEKEELNDKGNFIDILKTPSMRKTTLALFPMWFTSALTFWGFSLSAGNLAGNIYLNVFLQGVIELPANFLGLFLMNTIGRRPTTVIALLISGACSTALAFMIGLHKARSTAVSVMSLVAKGFITVSFSGSFLYTVELYPTAIRNTGLAACAGVARIGATVAPFIATPLFNAWKPGPSVVYAALAIISGLIAISLPETLGRELPETIEEATEFRKGRYKKKKPEEKTAADNKAYEAVEHNKPPENDYQKLSHVPSTEIKQRPAAVQSQSTTL